MATSGGVREDLDPHEKYIWGLVSLSPAKSLWDLQGATLRSIAIRTWKAVLEDRLFSVAAELGFYFLFALFPALICATSVLGLIARSAVSIYDRLLEYMALVIPSSALGAVVSTFNETAAHSSPGKLTLGLMVAIWSASAGVSAMQDATNAVYKLVDRRSYIKARLQAIVLTVVLISTISLCLASLFGGDFVAGWLQHRKYVSWIGDAAVNTSRVCGWVLAAGFLAFSFAAVYYWAPDLRVRRWHWITPGATLGIAGWLLASLGFRLYLHFFNSYSVTYGSLGALVILLMWFYITGLMLLLGAEFNSELEAAAVEARLKREKTESRLPAERKSSVPAA